MENANAMPDKYLWEKTIDALQESVKANQSSANANTKNAEATDKIARLVEDQHQISQNLITAVGGLNETMREVVKGLEAVAAGQKIMAEGSVKDKEKYFKYLVYCVVFIIILLGGSAALKIFFGIDLTSIFK